MSNQLKLNGLNNTRDLCGMRGADGRKIRSGKLIRSGHLFFADASDLNVLKETVGMIVDFRTARERKEKPDPVIPGVRYMELPVLTESTAGITREEDSDRRAMTASMRDPDTAKEYMCGMYRTIGSSDYCAKQYEQFVKLLMEEREKVLLWHCTAGKDRAGFGAVIAAAVYSKVVEPVAGILAGYAGEYRMVFGVLLIRAIQRKQAVVFGDDFVVARQLYLLGGKFLLR
jgi:protein-tyrosine phosphatase